MNKVLFYGLGNARDHANHHYSKGIDNTQFFSIIQNNNALMENYDNVYVIKSLNEAINFAKNYNPDLVVISNRKDLNNGVYEEFKRYGFNVFGINKKAAKLESDKIYAKRLMSKYNVPTPNYFYTTSLEKATDFLYKNWNKSKYGYVLKVCKNAKKSFDRTSVPRNLDDAIEETKRLFNTLDNVELLIEECIVGYEISLHILIKDGKYSILPIVQDYKRKYKNNTGPMTAGTSSVASTQIKYDYILKKMEKEVIKPTMNLIEKERIEYNYILYIGVIIDKNNNAFVLEYNTRSGNPEWLAILGLLNCSLISMYDNYYNNFDNLNKMWKREENSVVIYGMLSEYPEFESSIHNEKILGFDKLDETMKLFGENIVRLNNNYYSSGGRVFALGKVSNRFEEAKKDIINSFSLIDMENLYFRDDIVKIEENIIK